MDIKMFLPVRQTSSSNIRFTLPPLPLPLTSSTMVEGRQRDPNLSSSEYVLSIVDEVLAIIEEDDVMLYDHHDHNNNNDESPQHQEELWDDFANSNNNNGTTREDSTPTTQEQVGSLLLATNPSSSSSTVTSTVPTASTTMVATNGHLRTMDTTGSYDSYIEGEDQQDDDSSEMETWVKWTTLWQAKWNCLF